VDVEGGGGAAFIGDNSIKRWILRGENLMGEKEKTAKSRVASKFGELEERVKSKNY